MKEKNEKHSYGCLMCLPHSKVMPHFVKFGKTAVLPSSLYTAEDGYGYTDEPHVTIKYGFAPDLNADNVKSVLRGIKPFDIMFNAISLFENENYDVVKFDVEHNDTLMKIRNRCNSFENYDEHPEYMPHSTIAYVKRGTFPYKKNGLRIKVPVNRMKYSDKNSNILYVDL